MPDLHISVNVYKITFHHRNVIRLSTASYQTNCLSVNRRVFLNQWWCRRL